MSTSNPAPHVKFTGHTDLCATYRRLLPAASAQFRAGVAGDELVRYRAIGKALVEREGKA